MRPGGSRAERQPGPRSNGIQGEAVAGRLAPGNAACLIEQEPAPARVGEAPPRTVEAEVTWPLEPAWRKRVLGSPASATALGDYAA